MSMNIPSTQNFRLMPFAPEKGWQDQIPYQLAIQWEQSAAFQLQPGEAVIGSGVVTKVEYDQLGKYVDGNYPLNAWILRHKDYDTGRPNIEVHLRVVVNGVTHVTVLKDDTITEGKFVDFFEQRQYVRLEDEEGFCWGLQRSIRTKFDPLAATEIAPHTPQLVCGAAVRVPVLFDQCMALSKTISRWLCDNVSALREPVSAPQAKALRELFEAPMLWLIDDVKRYQQFYDRAKGDLSVALTTGEGADEFMRDLRRKVSKGNRIATDAQRALHERLKRTFKELQKDRSNPENRKISLGSLMGLHTKWTNAVAEHRDAFLEGNSTVSPAYMVRWLDGDQIEYWMQPLVGWGLRNTLGTGRFTDSALIANRYDTLERAQAAFNKAVAEGGKTKGTVQIVARGLKVVDHKVLSQTSTGPFRTIDAVEVSKR